MTTDPNYNEGCEYNNNDDAVRNDAKSWMTLAFDPTTWLRLEKEFVYRP